MVTGPNGEQRHADLVASIPVGRFRVAQRHPLAVGVKETEVVLSVGVSLFGFQNGVW